MPERIPSLGGREGEAIRREARTVGYDLPLPALWSTEDRGALKIQARGSGATTGRKYDLPSVVEGREVPVSR